MSNILFIEEEAPLTEELWPKLQQIQEKHRQFPIVEIYGPVVQGEGEMIGVQTHFIRFGGCDYRCKWCDSMYAVDPEQVKINRVLMTAEDIADKVAWLDRSKNGAYTPWVTLSGGNPAMFDLTDVVRKLKGMGYKIAVETQGSIWQEWFRSVDCLTLSPKPPSSRMETDFEVLTRILGSAWDCKPNLKVVVFDETDYEYALYVHQRFPQVPFTMQVGTDLTPAEVNENFLPRETDALNIISRMEILWSKVLSDPRAGNIKVLPQLHTMVYGQKRGV